MDDINKFEEQPSFPLWMLIVDGCPLQKRDTLYAKCINLLCKVYEW